MITQWSTEQDLKRLSFISDLHLFSDRCNASEHAELITRTIDDTDLCVWGGDLFDFRWSRMGSERASVSRAIGWLEDWYERFPSKQFIYLDGNHDAHGPFRQALAEWARRRDRFDCGMDCVRIDNVLLLHGDVIEGKGNLDAFADYRGRWENKPVASNVASSVYDMAVAARVHKAAAMAAHRRRATCIRLLRWMHQQPADATDGIRRIVFGHTHRRIDGYRVGDIEFFNGGATIRHVPFSPVVLDLEHPT
jgi:UDP-2,3-diacylglucosamine hydrolase